MTVEISIPGSFLSLPKIKETPPDHILTDKERWDKAVQVGAGVYRAIKDSAQVVKSTFQLDEFAASLGSYQYVGGGSGGEKTDLVYDFEDDQVATRFMSELQTRYPKWVVEELQSKVYVFVDVPYKDPKTEYYSHVSEDHMWLPRDDLDQSDVELADEIQNSWGLNRIAKEYGWNGIHHAVLPKYFRLYHNLGFDFHLDYVHFHYIFPDTKTAKTFVLHMRHEHPDWRSGMCLTPMCEMLLVDGSAGGTESNEAYRSLSEDIRFN